MFTGIVEAIGECAKREERADVLALTLSKPIEWSLTIGQSIAVNGVCVTVTDFSETTFTVELMPETLLCTNFGNDKLLVYNLERAMLASDRFEGHIVQGHIDACGMIMAIEDQGQTQLWTIQFSPEYRANLVEKGSIAVDGVSLTVIKVEANNFTFGLIPHTLTQTIFSSKQVGEPVHLEFDIIGKYLLNT